MTTEVVKKCVEFSQREFNTKETLSLLNRYGFKFWSWGATNFNNIENKCLVFRVRGNHHKGYVAISLSWDDTYRVMLITTRGTVKEEILDVYFDQLFDVIDKKIEWIEDYKR